MSKKITAVFLALALLLCAAVIAVADDENEISRCELYVESNLTRMGYSDLDSRTEIAVGDTVEILYEDSVPADVYVDGVLSRSFKGGEREFFFLKIEKTGSVEVSVKKEDNVILSKRFTVISSSEMYRKTLSEAFGSLFKFDFEMPDAGDLQGFPAGNPFLPLAFLMTAAVNAFSLLFAFTRIVR